MDSSIYRPDPPRVALLALEHAIQILWQSTGHTTKLDGPFQTELDHYRTGPMRPEQHGVPPRLWPEVLTVTEDLLGASFVVAQTFLLGIPQDALTPRQRGVIHVANYWKHRSEWNDSWDESGENRRTIPAIRALGASPPVKVGQMESLVQTVLRGHYSAEALWLVIAPPA